MVVERLEGGKCMEVAIAIVGGLAIICLVVANTNLEKDEKLAATGRVGATLLTVALFVLALAK